MLEKIWPAGTAAVLAVLVVGGISGAAGSASRADARDFTAVDVPVTQTNVDVDQSNSFTVGDETISKDMLKTPAGATMGSLTSVCTATAVVSDQNVTLHCEATARIWPATIEIAGLIRLRQPQPKVRLAITGGTRRFDAARGQVSVQFGQTQNLLYFDVD
jgi:hypothetical protein